MTLAATLENLSKTGCTVSLQGIFNVESGSLGVATAHFEECNSCGGISQESMFILDCKTCGRNKENYFWMRAGDGDGLYSVFELNFELEDEIVLIGVIVLLDSDAEYSKPLMEAAISSGASEFSLEFLEEYKELESLDIGKIAFSDSHIRIADASWGVNSRDVAVTVFENEGTETMHFKVFCESPGEGYGQYSSEISPLPRVLIGIDARYTQHFFHPSTLRINDPKEVLLDWTMFGVQASHLVPVWDIAIWFNYQLEMAPVNSSAEYDPETLDTLTFFGLSWLIKGIADGDLDCNKALDDYAIDRKRAASGLFFRDMPAAANELIELDDLDLWRELATTGKLKFRSLQEDSQSVQPEFKTCPMCAEEIKFAAKKCRYCQHLIMQD